MFANSGLNLFNLATFPPVSAGSVRATLSLFGHVLNHFASLSLGDDDDETSLKMPSWLTAATTQVHLHQKNTSQNM